eukprot:6492174-Amphidinium_carterae.1
MGWSWAFYFGQQAHVAEVCRALRLCPNELLSDVRPAPEIVDNALLVLPYCDNLTIGSDCKERANSAREDVASLCRRAGYIVHEEESASLCVKSLGFEIDGDQGVLSVGANRHQKVDAVLRFLLKHPVVNGRQLERVLGQVTFLFLIRRDLLAVFGRCYAFVRAHYQYPHRLWGCCLKEIRAAVALLPLAIADLRRTVSNRCYMTDASLRGFGVMVGDFPERVVQQACKYDERWRFKREYRGTGKARDVVLNALEDLDSVKPSGESDEVWVEDLSFPYLARIFLQQERWSELFAGRFEYDEPIHLLEARALLLAVKRMTRERNTSGHECLLLSDSMCCALAFSKGRCGSAPLLGVCRKKASFCLASNLLVHVRWVASEHNWADKASRRHLTESDLRNEARIKALRKWYVEKGGNGKDRAVLEEKVRAGKSQDDQGDEGPGSDQAGELALAEGRTWGCEEGVNDEDIVFVHGLLSRQPANLGEEVHEASSDAEKSEEEEKSEYGGTSTPLFLGKPDSDGADKGKLQEHADELHEVCKGRRSLVEQRGRSGQSRVFVHGENVRGWMHSGQSRAADSDASLPLPSALWQTEGGHSTYGPGGEGIPQGLPPSFPTTFALGDSCWPCH